MKRSKTKCKRFTGGAEAAEGTKGAESTKGTDGMKIAEATGDTDAVDMDDARGNNAANAANAAAPGFLQELINTERTVVAESSKALPLIWKCFELTNSIGMITKYTILFAFLLFVILPVIVVILCIAFLIDLINKMYTGKNADFYGDTLMSVQVTKIYSFGGSYINEYVLTFFIIIILYVFSVLVYFFLVTKHLASDCYIRATFENNLVKSVIFYGILLAIVIIDVLNYKEFTNTVGAIRAKVEEKIKTVINTEYIDQLTAGNTSTSAITDGNNRSALQTYINGQAAKETSADITQIKQNEPYKKIKTACLTYLIIKTLDENDYGNKRAVVIDKAFLTDTSKLFLSVSYISNRLIYANIKRCFKFDTKISGFWDTIKESIIKDCTDQQESIDKDILDISHKTASAMSSKVIFFSLLTTLCKFSFDYANKNTAS
jgi:hypothetical protein